MLESNLSPVLTISQRALKDGGCEVGSKANRREKWPLFFTASLRVKSRP